MEQRSAFENASRAIGNNEVTPLELILLKWQYQLYGDFYTKLWETLVVADETNTEKLALAFPDEVHALHAWRTTWIAEALRNRGLLD